MSWTDKFDPALLKMVKEVDTQIAPQLAAIDARILENQDKVLTSFQKHHVAESYLTGSTGYGHNDEGRDVLEEIYADVLGGEDAFSPSPVGFWHSCHWGSFAGVGASR